MLALTAFRSADFISLEVECVMQAVSELEILYDEFCCRDVLDIVISILFHV